MQEWLKVSLILCTFGLVKEIRPGEPYETDFLLGPWRNLTEETVTKDVYPVGTYSYLAQLVVVFLVTDYLKYKPFIILSGICGIFFYSLLLWTKSLEWLQVAQFVYGLFLATEVAYYTYMYAKVDADKYDKVTSWTRAAALIGMFLSGVTGQVLVSFSVMNLRQLNYISFITQIVSIIWAVLLPGVNRSVYFHCEVAPPLSADKRTLAANDPQTNGFYLIWEHARSAYTKTVVLAWSLWYAASMAGFMQVQAYVQLLWQDIDPGQENLYNGIVEAALTALGALAALSAGRTTEKLRRAVLPALPAIAALGKAGGMLAATFATELWPSYLGYIILGVIYHYMITIASAEIARNLVYESCFGLVFGINTLFAVILQSILTLIVISESGMELDIRGQFRAYAVCYAVLGIIVFVVWLTLVIHNFARRSNPTKVPAVVT